MADSHPLRQYRVCHLTTSHQPDDVRILTREVRALSRRSDVQVLIAAPGHSHRLGVQHIKLKGATGRAIKRWMSGPVRALPAVIRSGADLYHLHDPELIPLVPFLQALGRKVVWDAHEDYFLRLDAGRFQSGASGRSPAGSLAGGLLKTVDARADGIVAATISIAETYANPNTVVVGNEAVLSDFAQCDPSPRSRQVLFVGAPQREHLFEQVVDAVAATQDLRLAVARDRIDTESFHYAELRLGDRFSFVGRLGREGLRQTISDSFVGMCTYGPTPEYMDPLASPTKFYEFAAAGLPIVASPIPSISRLAEVSRAAIVTSDFSSAAIEYAFRTLISDNDTWRALAANGRSWSQCTDPWRKSEESLLTLYENLLPLRGRR